MLFAGKQKFSLSIDLTDHDMPCRQELQIWAVLGNISFGRINPIRTYYARWPLNPYIDGMCGTLRHRYDIAAGSFAYAACNLCRGQPAGEVRLLNT